MSSPFQPPPRGRVGPIAGSTQPQRPGMVPTPPEREQQRRRGPLTGTEGNPLALPRRPEGLTAEEADTEEATAPTDRWAYSHTGPAGAEGQVTGLSPSVELDEMRPLSVQFFHNPVPSEAPVTPQLVVPLVGGRTFGALPYPGGMTGNDVRLNSEAQTDATQVFLAIPDVPPIGYENLEEWLPDQIAITIELTWQSGGEGSPYSTMLYRVISYEITPDDGFKLVTFAVEPVETVVHGPPLEDEQLVGVTVRGYAKPNVAARARVAYRSGKSDLVFDCDWAGGFQVYADRLDISRLTFAPSPDRPYGDGPIAIAAQVIADAPRPSSGLAYTVIPQPVATDGYIEIPVHPFARRVNLLLKYGNSESEEASGDPPLGQILIAWGMKYGGSVGYIDAMSAREALFGQGHPVPFGASSLVLSNRSADDSIHLGAIWRIEL